jgi:hypothetical protein
MSGGVLFGRLRGKSDIIYIGKTEGQNGIKGRLANYFRKPGKTQWTNQRIYNLVQRYNWEVSWCLTEKPQDLERILLKKYEEEHDELPPLNRASRNFLRDFADLPASFYVRHNRA